ncbi:hypothetical protein OX284_006630 [Flavobacterium sp. SUN046]|uniref:hypothetical protein n=1 Tax=Flavobacterium sp. SUN046 TaxID=3002440 RepID=UPI002DB5ACBD|nr:hypothetical protein [Flavobacterium sp. SUN046]MEC4049098.1 hypothetical protein [Flavobacterium sp. SUN046]
MKIKFALFLLLTLLVNGYSQCKYNEYYEVSNIPSNTISFDLTGSSDTRCCKIEKISSYSEFIFSKAKQYITERGGAHFFNQLKARGLYVEYLDLSEVDDTNPALFELSQYNVAYQLDYVYTNGKFTYDFIVKLDKSGEIISDDAFPAVAQNSKFEKLTDICAAIQVVKVHPKFKNQKVDIGRLNYNEETGNFCWIITNATKKLTPGMHDVIICWFYVNANNNKLEKIEKHEETFVIPEEDQPVPKVKSKKKKK